MGERAASTAAGATFSPPVTISSLIRPSTCSRPSAVEAANVAGVKQPVRGQRPRRDHRATDQDLAAGAGLDRAPGSGRPAVSPTSVTTTCDAVSVMP